MTESRDPISDLRAGFFDECGERIEQLQDALLACESAAEAGELADPETVNTAFRAIHSIKGGAGVFGFDALVRFSHGVETALDFLREGLLTLSPPLVTALIRAGDHVAEIVDATRAGLAPPPGAADILAALSGLGTGTPPPSPTGDATRPWQVRFQPHSALYTSGNEALFPLLALRELGAGDVKCDASALPDLAALDPEEAYLAWTLTLPGGRGEPEISEVFDFVVGLCDLTVTRKAPPASNAPRNGPLTQTTAAPPSMRVDLDRIDRLMNLVGELAISQSILAQRITEAGLDRLSDLTLRLEAMGGLTRDIQDSVMTIRAQPVKPLFQRMGRVLRETSTALGKPARLQLDGEATEVDRTVIERLADPLMHMIRNAIDHGLETPEERRRRGKPAEGRVVLSAAHRAGRLVIELSDDGRGLDRDRIRAKAEERGLITPGESLNDVATDQLLFRPGFSTAPGLSDISGRGVGMDVVKTAITRLGGRIAIRSEPGEGTRFTLSLPLTLAVMDGMVVRVAGQILVIPVAAIMETAALRTLDRRAPGTETELVRMRNGFAAFVDTGVALGMRAPGHLPDAAIAVLTTAEDNSRAALIVDAVIDQRQVVIKPLRGGFGRIPGISAATILGDGQIAFICDPGEMARSGPAGRPDLAHTA